MTFDDFMLYKDAWTMYRNLGHIGSSGAFVSPISFTESLYLPERMLNVFFELDSLVSILTKPKRK